MNDDNDKKSDALAKDTKSPLEENGRKVFKHQFGSITKVSTSDNLPVHATFYICSMYWDT